jgi:hypothetical protein
MVISSTLNLKRKKERNGRERGVKLGESDDDNAPLIGFRVRVSDSLNLVKCTFSWEKLEFFLFYLRTNVYSEFKPRISMTNFQ